MANLLESMGQCLWFDVERISRRNLVAVILAGLLFFSGWWVAIYESSVNNSLLPSHYVCGILGTISFFMVNSITNEMINGAGYTEGCMGQNGSKIWLFTGFVLGFAAMIASVWILIANYTAASETDTDHRKEASVILFLQNIFILFSSLIYKFGRSDGNDYLNGF